MTKQDYDFINQYRLIIDHFAAHQIYVGGADVLFAKYLQPSEIGCTSCKSAFLIEKHLQLKQYEDSMPGV